MASHNVFDLTDEAGLLAEDRVEYDSRGVRALLSELRLKPIGGPMVVAAAAEVFDFAVCRATGDRRLAMLFGTAA